MTGKPKLRPFPFPGLGERIRIAMRRAGHQKFAGIAEELGVTESSLSRWCNGHEISLVHAVALARCLDVSLDWLITGNEPRALNTLPDAQVLRHLGETLLHLSELRDAPAGTAQGPPVKHSADITRET